MANTSTLAGHPVPHLSLEIWMEILEWIPKGFDFFAAMVCKDWAWIMRRKRHGRKKWRTWIGYAISSPQHLAWARTKGGIRENSLRHITSTMWDDAAREGIVGIAEYLKKKQVPLKRDGEMFLYAAACGHIEFLKHMRPEIDRFNHWHRVIHAATCGGRLAVLKWVVETGHPLAPEHEDLCSFATGMWWRDDSDLLDMLKWLREQGCPWNSRVCTNLAVYGNGLEVMMWAVRNGCPFNVREAWEAALRSGSLQSVRSMRYLRKEYNVRWGHKDILHTAYRGRIRCLEYAASEGELICIDVLKAAMRNVDNPSSGHMETVDWLVDAIGLPETGEVRTWREKMKDMKIEMQLDLQMYEREMDAIAEEVEERGKDEEDEDNARNRVALVISLSTLLCGCGLIIHQIFC